MVETLKIICDSCGKETLYEDGRCVFCGWVLDMNENMAEYIDEEEEKRERFVGIPYDDYI